MSEFDLNIPQGTTWRCTWPLTDDQGDAVDLEGYTAKAQIRSGAGGSLFHEWTEADGIELLASTLTLVLTPADTIPWTWARGAYDIHLTSPEGEISRVGFGRVLLERSVTV